VLAPRGVHAGARIEQLGKEAASAGLGHHALAVIQDLEGAVQLDSGGRRRGGERGAAPRGEESVALPSAIPSCGSPVAASATARTCLAKGSHSCQVFIFSIKAMERWAASAASTGCPAAR
jgi:hypothetical protein